MFAKYKELVAPRVEPVSRSGSQPIRERMKNIFFFKKSLLDPKEYVKLQTGGTSVKELCKGNAPRVAGSNVFIVLYGLMLVQDFKVRYMLPNLGFSIFNI